MFKKIVVFIKFEILTVNNGKQLLIVDICSFLSLNIFTKLCTEFFNSWIYEINQFYIRYLKMFKFMVT